MGPRAWVDLGAAVLVHKTQNKAGFLLQRGLVITVGHCIAFVDVSETEGVRGENVVKERVSSGFLETLVNKLATTSSGEIK